ncbi:STAS domain-containing protein [Chitinophaga rhizophila]|uniref:STAS domain-containing protein n=1 Tax=Chitinophaga rhizophila TaxID=2866212 RepID=A0ABS7GBY4_9BACT|nr:STAS domain-containing protein [Chitinophaga rhizophila]MBW8685192.1 STAS domain-containing protein [Chitinophaga rhizophila]
MEFKIDTKEKILVVQPQIKQLDANLSAGFTKEVSELPGLEGRNLILDMTLVENADDAGINAILTVYHQQYDSGLSCAVTGLNSALTNTLRAADESVYNVVPTMSEAIDMVMMEDLERELLQDEE